MRRPLLTLLSLFALASPACAGIVTLSGPSTIKVYSGGHLVYQGVVTDQLQSLDDRLFVFQDKCSPNTDKTVVVSGDLLVTRGPAACPTAAP